MMLSFATITTALLTTAPLYIQYCTLYCSLKLQLATELLTADPATTPSTTSLTTLLYSPILNDKDQYWLVKPPRQGLLITAQQSQHHFPRELSEDLAWSLWTFFWSHLFLVWSGPTRFWPEFVNNWWHLLIVWSSLGARLRLEKKSPRHMFHSPHDLLRHSYTVYTVYKTDSLELHSEHPYTQTLIYESGMYSLLSTSTAWLTTALLTAVSLTPSRCHPLHCPSDDHYTDCVVPITLTVSCPLHCSCRRHYNYTQKLCSLQLQLQHTTIVTLRSAQCPVNK